MKKEKRKVKPRVNNKQKRCQGVYPTNYDLSSVDIKSILYTNLVDIVFKKWYNPYNIYIKFLFIYMHIYI